jgi:hypothetical protein
LAFAPIGPPRGSPLAYASGSAWGIPKRQRGRRLPGRGDEKWDRTIESTYGANDHTFVLPADPAGEEFEPRGRTPLTGCSTASRNRSSGVDAKNRQASSREIRNTGLRWLLYAALTAITLVFIYPFVWLVSTSFKPRGEVFDNKLIPETTTTSACGRKLRWRCGCSTRCW